MITACRSYRERADHCRVAIGKQLLLLLDEKKTNLALAADVTDANTLLTLAATLGPEICMLKTHIDILTDFSPEVTNALRALAAEHHFILFEDRKFADIGHTVKQQYAGGLYHIADWADIVNAHVLPGPGIIQGLADVGLTKNRGLVLLAEMSSAGHLMTTEYQQQTLRMAQQFPDFVIGFITQHALTDQPQWINMTPGVKLTAGFDHLLQQYCTPQQAIKENGSDIIIVGRDIVNATDTLATAKRYRKAAWDSYCERCAEGD